jgi:hypothetical protein
MKMEVDILFVEFILFFAFLFLVFAPWYMNRLDAWVRLKKEYHFNGPFSGKIWRPLLFSMRGSGWLAPFYGEMFPYIKLGGNSRGLYLAYPSLLFLKYHSVLVPWEEVIAHRKTWAIPNFEFLFKKVNGVSVLVSSGTAHELAILAGNN